MPSKKQFNKDIIRSVDVSGLGGDAFQQSLMNLYLWDVHMSRQFEASAWKPWASVLGNEYGTVQFSNRVLTPAFLCEEADAIMLPAEFGKHVKTLVDEGTYRFIQDNQVDLYEHVNSAKVNK